MCIVAGYLMDLVYGRFSHLILPIAGLKTALFENTLKLLWFQNLFQTNSLKTRKVFEPLKIHITRFLREQIEGLVW